jgi:hypothetical protein
MVTAATNGARASCQRCNPNTTCRFADVATNRKRTCCRMKAPHVDRRCHTGAAKIRSVKFAMFSFSYRRVKAEREGHLVDTGSVDLGVFA